MKIDVTTQRDPQVSTDSYFVLQFHFKAKQYVLQFPLASRIVAMLKM